MDAEYMKEVAKTHENAMRYAMALEAFKKAADMFELDGSQSAADECLIKVAFYEAMYEQYSIAAILYENVARRSVLRSPTAVDHVNGLLLNAGLCRLIINDTTRVRSALETYNGLSSFSNTREGELFGALIAAVESLDDEGFVVAVTKYDTTTKFDGWRTSILLKIRNAIRRARTVVR